MAPTSWPTRQYPVTIFLPTDYASLHQVTRLLLPLNITVQKTPYSTARYTSFANSRLRNIHNLSTPLPNQRVTPHHISATQRASRLLFLRNLTTRYCVSPAGSLARRLTARASNTHKIGQRSELRHKYRATISTNTGPQGLLP